MVDAEHVQYFGLNTGGGWPKQAVIVRLPTYLPAAAAASASAVDAVSAHSSVPLRPKLDSPAYPHTPDSHQPHPWAFVGFTFFSYVHALLWPAM